MPAPTLADPTPGVRAGHVRWLVPLGLGLALALLTVAVVTHSWVTRLDAQIEGGLPRHGTWPVLDRLATVVTTVAQPAANVAVAFAVAVFVAARTRAWRSLVAPVAALGLLTATVLLGKVLISRPGPPGSETDTGLGYFPSGHTTSALVCVGVVALSVAALRPRWHRRALVLIGAWTLLVGWGLVWKHFHWVSDVVAGILLGTLILWLTFARQGLPSRASPSIGPSSSE
ncbi:phosphatase PAP2 family protein [Oryzihumus sp.]|uniref:phosphatase PAP2 family protein n=1 Tax=Oryzihumus sp. TaxID=1968903 RepID=UPI002EDA7D4B